MLKLVEILMKGIEMPGRTLEAYQALHRDFEKIDYFIDSTSTTIRVRPYSFWTWSNHITDDQKKNFSKKSGIIPIRRLRFLKNA